MFVIKTNESVPNRTLYFDVIWCSFKLSFALLYRPSFSLSSKMKLFLSSLKKFRISKLNNDIQSWLVLGKRTDCGRNSSWGQFMFQNKANYQLEVFVFTNATPRMQTHDLKSKFMNSFEESITESGSGDITLWQVGLWVLFACNIPSVVFRVTVSLDFRIVSPVCQPYHLMLFRGW